jgi:penicillin-binding protein 2
MNGDSPRLRMSVLGIVVFSLFAALFARLWYLQVMTTDEFAVVAEANRLRVVPVEAPRGRILDRNGTVLVDNRISIQVTIDRAALVRLDGDDRQTMLELLASALTRAGNPTTVEQLEERIADQRYSPYVPVPVAADISEQLKIWIDEHAAELPAVTAERVAVRAYPYGTIAAHLLGYVGKISQDEFDARKDSPKTYNLNDDIGKAGVEVVYEDHLRGMPGERQIEVDTDGTPVQVVSEREPRPGNDLVLSIDVDIQALAESALSAGMERARGNNKRAPAGSVVVLDPRDGAVVAMASNPNFNPASFIDGISASEWEVLTDPTLGYPLNNWAMMGQYAPGSTFKLFTGLSALRGGLITPETSINDPGYFRLANCTGRCEWQNAGRTPYGTVDLRRAMTVSSDVYFYTLGARFWIDRDMLGGEEAMQEGLRPFGLGVATGIDLPGERSGRIPSPEWRKEFCSNPNAGCIDDNWYTGDNINMSIGQGDVLMTPLQLANAYATFANGGTVYRPRVAMEVLDGVTGEVVEEIEPVAESEAELPPEHRQPMLDGLVGVTTSPEGTASTTFATFPSALWPVAGKTGTAEVNNKDDTALFAAFGPANDPRYSVVAVVEEAGFGGSVSAPIVRQVFDGLVDPTQIAEAPLANEPAVEELVPTTLPPEGAED